MEKPLIADLIELPDLQEYYYKVSKDERNIYKFRLFKKIKHDTDKILISMGNSDFYEFLNDVIYVVHALKRYGINAHELNMYKV